MPYAYRCIVLTLLLIYLLWFRAQQDRFKRHGGWTAQRCNAISRRTLCCMGTVCYPSMQPTSFLYRAKIPTIVVEGFQAWLEAVLFALSVLVHHLTMHYPYLFFFFLSFASYTILVRAFSSSVSTSSPTQCGPLTVEWTGGQPPFEIMLLPAFNIPRNISVPSSAFTNNQGSYQIPEIPFDNKTTFLVTMSDASGFGSGGTSSLLTVGDPVGGASCNTTPPAIPFTFNLPDALQQCSPYAFTEYDGATMPITIAGLIPEGIPLVLYPPSGPTSYDWIADVPAGTTIIFTLTDAQGRSGGASDTQLVALSNDNSCLNAHSPSSTASSPLSTSSTSAPTATSSTVPTNNSSVSIGVIVGAVAGTVIALAAIAALVLFCLKRWRYNRQPYGIAPTGRRHSVDLDPGVDNFSHPPIYPFPYQADSASHLAPPVVPSSATTSSYHLRTDSIGQLSPSIVLGSATGPVSPQRSRSDSNSEFGGFGEATSSTMTSTARRKAELAGIRPYQPATRFVVHTDAEDNVSVEEDEVVELPPQYSDRREPGGAGP